MSINKNTMEVTRKIGPEESYWKYWMFSKDSEDVEIIRRCAIMHKFGIVSLVKGLIFTQKFAWWIYKTQPEQDYMWFEDHWDEFWDGYGELLTELSEIAECETEKEAFGRWANMDICRTYYLWMQERHGSNADLVADCLYLLWARPAEA